VPQHVCTIPRDEEHVASHAVGWLPRWRSGPQEQIAALGSIKLPLAIAGREVFWRELHETLGRSPPMG